LSTHNVCTCYEFPETPSVKNKITYKPTNLTIKYFCADCYKFNLDDLKTHNLQNHKHDSNFPIIKCNTCNIVMLGYNANMDLHKVKFT